MAKKRKERGKVHRAIERVVLCSLAVGVAFVVAAVVVMHAIDSRYDARVQALRDAGDPVTPSDLDHLYALPPGSENAAGLYEAAFKKMRLTFHTGADKPPIELVEEATRKPGSRIPGDLRAALRDHMAKNAEALRLLHRAAAVETCQFELDFSEGLLHDDDHVGGMLRAARLLTLEAVCQLDDGQLTEAAHSLAAALRVGRALGREPTFDAGMSSFLPTWHVVLHAERWMAAADPLPVDACRRLEEALRAAAEPERLERMLTAVRCLTIQNAQRYLEDGFHPVATYVRLNLLHYLDETAGVVALARQPYPRSLIAGSHLEEPTFPRYCIWAQRMMPPDLGRAFRRAQWHMAGVDCARMALAALRHKAARGRLPDTLAALMPAFIDEVPPDPFDGRPLRYRRRHDGFSVYAIGPDGADDGGEKGWRDEGWVDFGVRVRWSAPRAR